MWTTPRHVLILCEFLLLCLISSSTGSPTPNKKSTRMSRMPLYYGKRSEASSGEDLVHLQRWAEERRSPNIGAARLSVADGASGQDLVMNEYLTSGMQPNRILDLDNDYSSENQQRPHDPPGQGDGIKGNFKMLFRLPAYFGNRHVMATDTFDESNLLEEYLKKTFLHALHALPRVPDFYSTRVQTYPGWSYLKSQDFNSVKRNSLSGMHNFYGKKGHGYTDSKPTNRNVMNILTRYFKTHNENQIPRLHSIAFRLSSGGRTDHREVSAASFNLPETSGIKQSDISDTYSTRLGHNSPSINVFTTDNRARGNHDNNNYDSTDDNGADETRDNNKYDDTDDNRANDKQINHEYDDYNAFSDDGFVPDNEDTNVKFSKRKFLSTLDRMPKFFGKRQATSNIVGNIHDKQRSEIPDSKDLQNYSFTNLPIEPYIPYGNLEVSSNTKVSPWQSAKRQHAKAGLHKILDIWLNTQISNILHPLT